MTLIAVRWPAAERQVVRSYRKKIAVFAAQTKNDIIAGFDSFPV